VVKTFDRIDMLFTSAGIHGGGSTVADTPVEIWDRVIGIDLKGVYLSARYAIPQMRRQGGGSIVNVSSIYGLSGLASGMPFQAAKGGLINLTRHMAIAHARENIRVNCICPGVVETPLTESWLSDPKRLARASSLHPMGRIGRIEEIASVVVFLLSDEASFMTGAIIPVDGGFMAGDRREPRGV
jgi:NAD(P)-dependent dehydrogenase (short-subunit alcohol dehydrogenase family)